MALVRAFAGVSPILGEGCFLAPNATLIGDIVLGDQVSVWYGCVLRGDVGKIRIGARSNVQDLCMIHMTTDVSNAVIGADVTVGHSAVIHGAIVEDGVLVGMGAILMDNAEVGAESIVGAGALLPPGMKVPPRSLVVGSPGRVVRSLTEEEQREGRRGAERYLRLAGLHDC